MYVFPKEGREKLDFLGDMSNPRAKNQFFQINCKNICIFGLSEIFFFCIGNP